MKRENNTWSNDFKEIKSETNQINFEQIKKQQSQDDKDSEKWLKIKEQLKTQKRVILQ